MAISLIKNNRCIVETSRRISLVSAVVRSHSANPNFQKRFDYVVVVAAEDRWATNGCCSFSFVIVRANKYIHMV